MKSEYVTCDDYGHIYACVCDFTIHDGWYTATWFFSLIIVTPEGMLFGITVFIFLFQFLYGTNSFRESIAPSISFKQKSGISPVNFGLKLIELIWILALVFSYKPMHNCCCDAPSPDQSAQPFRTRKTMFIYCIILMVLISTFLLSRRIIVSCIKNIRIKREVEIKWFRMYFKAEIHQSDEQALLSNESY